MLTVGSLFAGIGGFDLGFERAGMRTLWQVEQNEFCRRVLAKHFPNAHQFIDVRHVTGDPKRWADEGGCLLEYVDVLCGGFPCQDISTAGKGAGIEGERSGLWSEYARLIGELRPRYVVVENVAALLFRGLGRVLGDLAEVGYDAEWDCLPASAVGAPHRRDRLWIVAYPQSTGREARDRDGLRTVARSSAGPSSCASSEAGVGHPEGDGRRQGRQGRPSPTGAGQRESIGALQDVPDAPGPRLEGRQQPEAARRSLAEFARRNRTGDGIWAAEPGVPRLADGVPDWVERTRANGNALVPQIAEWIGRRIIEWEGGVSRG